MSMEEHSNNTGGPTPLGDDQRGYILVPWDPRMSEGAGYDSVSLTVLPPAFEEAMTTSEKSQGDGQTGELKVKQVQSLQQLSEQVSVQSGLKVGYDVFSSTALGSFLQERRINQFCLYFMVLSYAQRSLVNYLGLTFKESAKELAASPAEFRRRYGNYYVAGYIAGGYLIGLAELQFKSEQVLMEVKAKVRGTYDRAVTVDASVESTWQSLEKTSGSDFSLQVIHAGVGEGIRAYAIGSPGGTGSPGTSSPGVVPSERRERTERPAIVRKGIADSQTKPWDDGGDDDIESTSGPAVKPDISGLPVTGASNTTTGSKPTDTPPLGNVVPRLHDEDAGYLPALKMNLDGMMKTATALQSQTGKNRVRLLALLAPYTALDGGPKNTGDPQDLSLLDLNKKRRLLAEYYSKASFIQDSVRYALENRGHFTESPQDLEALEAEMGILIAEYLEQWQRLKNSPSSVAIGDIKAPNESKLPKWAVKKSKFRPFSEEMDSQLFVDKLEEAVDKAIATDTADKREVLKEYVKFVQENSAENYGNVILVLENLSEAFPLLDDNPARRTRELKSLERAAQKGVSDWNLASKRILEQFRTLDGKSGLDQKQLKFLAPLNAILFGEAEDERYGFKAFWKKLYEELQELTLKSDVWRLDQKLADLIDYDSNDWSAQAEEFRQSKTALGVKVRAKLI